MEKIKSAVDGLIASRKGLLALMALVGVIKIFLLLTWAVFLCDLLWWKTGRVEFNYISDITSSGFIATTGVITAYSAANIAKHYINKKKDENGGKHGRKR